MPDNPELIDQYKDELHQLIQRMRNDGIPLDTTRFVFQETTEDLDTMVYSASGLSQDAPEKPEKGH